MKVATLAPELGRCLVAGIILDRAAKHSTGYTPEPWVWLYGSSGARR